MNQDSKLTKQLAAAQEVHGEGILVHELIRTLRHLVLEHPHADKCEVVMAPHGHGHRQRIANIHFNHHETKVVLEAER